jgi:hypothetical protein
LGLQAQMLQWSDVICDDQSVKQIKEIQDADLMGLDAQLGVILGKTQSQIQRCIFLRKNFASQASLWFKEKVKPSTP